MIRKGDGTTTNDRSYQRYHSPNKDCEETAGSHPGKIWVLALAPLVKPAAASSTFSLAPVSYAYRGTRTRRPACVSPAASPEDIEEPRARRKEKQMRERVHEEGEAVEHGHEGLEGRTQRRYISFEL